MDTNKKFSGEELPRAVNRRISEYRSSQKSTLLALENSTTDTREVINVILVNKTVKDTSCQDFIECSHALANEYVAELSPEPPDEYDSLKDPIMYGFNASTEPKFEEFIYQCLKSVAAKSQQRSQVMYEDDEVNTTVRAFNTNTKRELFKEIKWGHCTNMNEKEDWIKTLQRTGKRHVIFPLLEWRNEAQIHFFVADELVFEERLQRVRKPVYWAISVMTRFGYTQLIDFNPDFNPMSTTNVTLPAGSHGSYDPGLTVKERISAFLASILERNKAPYTDVHTILLVPTSATGIYQKHYKATEHYKEEIFDLILLSHIKVFGPRENGFILVSFQSLGKVYHVEYKKNHGYIEVKFFSSEKWEQICKVANIYNTNARDVTHLDVQSLNILLFDNIKFIKVGIKHSTNRRALLYGLDQKNEPPTAHTHVYHTRLIVVKHIHDAGLEDLFTFIVTRGSFFCGVFWFVKLGNSIEIAPKGSDEPYLCRIDEQEGLPSKCNDMVKMVAVVYMGSHLDVIYRPFMDIYLQWVQEAMGSSSGSTAIVASGLCAAALGNDGGGSVRIFFSLCGVVHLEYTNGHGTEEDPLVRASSTHQNRTLLLIQIFYWDPGIDGILQLDSTKTQLWRHGDELVVAGRELLLCMKFSSQCLSYQTLEVEMARPNYVQEMKLSSVIAHSLMKNSTCYPRRPDYYSIWSVMSNILMFLPTDGKKTADAYEVEIHRALPP